MILAVLGLIVGSRALEIVCHGDCNHPTHREVLVSQK